MIDNHVVKTCMGFIERHGDKMQMAAQGIIMYNAYRYWYNWYVIFMYELNVRLVLTSSTHIKASHSCRHHPDD